MTLISVRGFCAKHSTVNHHSIFPNLFRFSTLSALIKINFRWRMAFCHPAVLLSITADYEVNIYPEPVQLRPKTPWKYQLDYVVNVVLLCVVAGYPCDVI